MEFTIPELEQLEAEFQEVESKVIAGYAQQYVSEAYVSSRGSEEHEIARRNFLLCMFGLVERSGLTSLAERCDFLNRRSTEVCNQVAQEAGQDHLPRPIKDSPATWLKRYTELFAAMNDKGHASKDEISFSMFVSIHENEGRYQHDLTKHVI